jgi:hypothetical protein
MGDMARDLGRGSVCPSIIGAQICAVTSFLTQGIADVAWPNGRAMPAGVSVLIVAPSTSGKSLTFHELMDPVESFLSAFPQEKAKRPLNFLIEDATREAILQSLGEWPVAGLFTDEAGMLTQLLSHASTLAKLHDGTPMRNSRVSTGRIVLHGQRLCALLMEQHDIFEAHKVLLGASNGGVGLANRYMAATTHHMPDVASLQHARMTESVKQLYWLKVETCMSESIAFVESGQKARPVLKLSHDAQACLLQLSNEMQQHKAPGAPYSRISEYLGRHVERVLRLAAAMHLFLHGSDGEIQADTLLAADAVGRWCLEAFYQMTYTPPKFSQADHDVQTLERAFQHVVQTTGNVRFAIADVRRGALNLGISGARFNRALPILTGQGKAQVLQEGRKEWVVYRAFSLPAAYSPY